MGIHSNAIRTSGNPRLRVLFNIRLMWNSSMTRDRSVTWYSTTNGSNEQWNVASVLWPLCKHAIRCPQYLPRNLSVLPWQHDVTDSITLACRHWHTSHIILCHLYAATRLLTNTITTTAIIIIKASSFAAKWANRFKFDAYKGCLPLVIMNIVCVFRNPVVTCFFFWWCSKWPRQWPSL